MILIWGLLEDPTTRSVYEALARRGPRVVFVNHADVARTSIRFTSGRADSYRLTCGDASYELTEMSAAYLRPYDYRDYADHPGPTDGAPVGSAELVHHLIGAWAESTAALVINRPSAEASNHSKLFQARDIAAVGFSVPRSLVTNEPERVREFQARYGRVIYKSMSSVRSIVQELGRGVLDGIGRMAPVLFQECVLGTNIRVHVVGEEAIACAIETDGVDYRYANRTHMTSATLSPEVSQRCVVLAKRLGLVVAGLDLIITASGEWYCLEVNPNPAFSVFEVADRPDIAQRVAKMLCEKTLRYTSRV
jgi:hypothetical protein